MYDDDVPPPLLLSSSSKYTKVAKYPTRNIKTPIVLVYGGSDSLVDITVMLRELPRQTVATEIPHYEHLDFLWARDVNSQVFQHVFDALESFTGAEHTKEEYERYRNARRSSLSASSFFRRHTQRNSDTALDSDVSTAAGTGSATEEGPTVEHREIVDGDARDERTGSPERVSSSHRHIPQLHESAIPSPNRDSLRARPRNTRASVAENDYTCHSPSSTRSLLSQDGVAEEGLDGSIHQDDEEVPAQLRTPKRRGTGGSHMSIESITKGGRGISLGAGKQGRIPGPELVDDVHVLVLTFNS